MLVSCLHYLLAIETMTEHGCDKINTKLATAGQLVITCDWIASMQVKNWRWNKCIRIKEKEAIYQANLLEEMLIFLQIFFPAKSSYSYIQDG